MAGLFTTENMIALVTLTTLEIVLGIDNVVFIAILAGRLPDHDQSRARRLGLVAAMATRLVLLACISWIMKLNAPLFALVGREFSGKDLILLFGGLFLIGKATFEIHDQMEGGKHVGPQRKAAARFARVIVQIMILDLVFSLDSVITAVGMADRLAIMVTAVVAAVAVMLVFVDAISGFIGRHPTLKVLALSFLILIGVMLVAEGLGKHIEKGYIYFAMAFALGVEMINLRVKRTQHEDRPQDA